MKGIALSLTMKPPLLSWMFLLPSGDFRARSMIKMLVSLSLVCVSFAFTPQEERQIVRDIAEIKATLEQLNKRIEDINKRIEDTNKRIEDVNKRIDDLMNFLWMLAGIFSAITAVTIGFALWDRRTMIRPFEDEDDKVARLLKYMNLM